jgi:hypothetical protein
LQDEGELLQSEYRSYARRIRKVYELLGPEGGSRRA